MIRTPTAFILGAGASAPYNYPVGIKLTELVLEGLRQGSSAWRTLTEAEFSPADLDRFRNSLQTSGRYSIDAFLQFRPEFLTIGKAAIACILIEREREQLLHSVGSDVDWYRYVFNKMTASIEKFHENEVSFITFNYDRSLEQFLFVSFKNSYGIGDEEAAQLVAGIPIIHLHGDIGLLPWQSDKQTRSYSSRRNPADLALAIQRMNIIHDDMKPRQDAFNSAQTILRNAKRRYFMGFSYDPINMERLKLNTVMNFRAEGTAYGLKQGEIHAIGRTSGNAIELFNLDCLSFLREVAFLE